MEESLDWLAGLAVAVRDWATLVFAVLAAAYAWQCRQVLRRRERLFANADVERLAEKTVKLRLRLRNETPADLHITRIRLVRPRPAVLAMDGIYEPGPGPIDCSLPVAAFDGAAYELLIGSPDIANSALRLRLRYAKAGKRLVRPRTLAVMIRT
ncbi:MAG: hypothetical protein GVY13_10080 [Alphaproteobacteria bacterium]|jgi:hypothetical protein|nr:hypothetical protein [Alphaproteobacteria bacterium]